VIKGEEIKMSDFSCPRCQSASIMGGPFGQSGVRDDGTPFSVSLGTRFQCPSNHVWEFDLKGNLTVLPDPPPHVPYVRTPIPVFDEWADLNQIMCPDRSRFDVLLEELPKCRTKAEVRTWIQREGFGSRYPILPESLPD
jgi:hypothetical protein